MDGDNIQGTANIIDGKPCFILASLFVLFYQSHLPYHLLGATLSLATLNNINMQEFWKQLSCHIYDQEDACFDFFWPLAASGKPFLRIWQFCENFENLYTKKTTLMPNLFCILNLGIYLMKLYV